MKWGRLGSAEWEGLLYGVWRRCWVRMTFLLFVFGVAFSAEFWIFSDALFGKVPLGIGSEGEFLVALFTNKDSRLVQCSWRHGFLREKNVTDTASFQPHGG